MDRVAGSIPVLKLRGECGRGVPLSPHILWNIVIVLISRTVGEVSFVKSHPTISARTAGGVSPKVFLDSAVFNFVGGVLYVVRLAVKSLKNSLDRELLTRRISVHVQ